MDSPVSGVRISPVTTDSLTSLQECSSPGSTSDSLMSLKPVSGGEVSIDATAKRESHRSDCENDPNLLLQDTSNVSSPRRNRSVAFKNYGLKQFLLNYTCMLLLKNNFVTFLNNILSK